MPNHVTNKIKLKGSKSEVSALLEQIRGKEDEQYVDFNNIIEMPRELKIESGSRGDDGYAVLTGKSQNMFMDITEILRRFWELPLEERISSLEMGMLYAKNLKKYGHKTWYDWCRDNWGTKWNAYEQNIEGTTLKFDTAWSSVVNLFVKLSTKHPNVEIDYKYADEDTGSNVGHVIIKNGSTIENLPENQSKEAYEMAFEINPDHKEYYKLKDGNYEHIEE